MSRHDAMRRITATDLVATRHPSEPALSADGSSAAFSLAEVDLARSEVRRQLWVAPRPDDDAGRYGARQLTHAVADARQPAYSPVGGALAFLTFRPQAGESEEDERTEDGDERCQVFVFEPGGADARRLTERADGVELFRWWPDGSGIATLGPAHRSAAERAFRRQREDALDDPHVVHGDIKDWEIWLHPLSGRAERLLPPKKGVDDFDVSPDGRLLAYATNHTGRAEDIDRSEIIVRDLDSGAERRLTRGRGGSESSPRFTRDGRFVVFHGWADPKISFSRQELVAVPVADVQAEPRLLLAGIDRDLEDFAVLPDGRVAAILAEGLDSRLVLLDPATGGAEEIDVGRRLLGALGAAPGAPVLAAVSEDAEHLAEIVRIDPASGGCETLTDLHPETAGWRRARRTRVSWENEGFEHHGLVLSPPGDPSGEAPPLVTWIHGGPHWRVTDTLEVYEAEALVAEGYAVFLPQYRGSSGHGQAYALASRRDLGGADARDVLAGIDLVVALGLGDPERMAVAGASYGGYLTNWLLASSDRFMAGISFAGIFDLTHDWATSDFASWDVHYLGATPWGDPELYHERSPLTHAESIEAPILVLHGLDDDNSFYTNSKGLHRALIELGRTTELVLYPREGHGLFEPAHRIDAIHRTLDWLGRHVSGRGADAGLHVAGRSVQGDGVRMLPMGHEVRREYAGVRPIAERVFLEVSLLLAAGEGGPDRLRLVPCGASADVVLEDAAGDLHRPIGVPLSVQETSVLFTGRGATEACRSEDGLPPALPLSVVFEIPEVPGPFRLRVLDLPPVTLDVFIEPEEPEEPSAEGPATPRQ